MWPFGTQNILDAQISQALPNMQIQSSFGALSGLMPQQRGPEILPTDIPQPQAGATRAPESGNRILNNPQLLNALGRMGGAITRANASGAGFGASLGAGTEAFLDEANRQQEFELQKQRVDSETRLRNAQIQKAEKDAEYGVKSSGFEGDIARARVILSDPMSTEQQRATAQAVIQTAERMVGSYDPVSGDFRYNARTQFGAPLGSSEGLGGNGMTPQLPVDGVPPSPAMQAPQGGLLPPPEMGATPDANMFNGTGNRKVDASLMEEAGKAQIAGRRAVNEGVGKVDSGTFEQIAGQTRTLSNMLPQLQRIEALAANTKTGGIGAARMEFGKMFGLDLDGVPESQAITAIQNAIGPSLRTPGSGASSDKDVAIFMSSIPTLMNTPAGIREINRTYEQLLDRKKEEEKIARRMLRDNGSLEGFYEETEKLGPVFKSGQIAAPAAAPSFDRSAIEAEMRRRMLK